MEYSTKVLILRLSKFCRIMFLQEKGNYPLHVAAAAAQASQVELLLIYGADPGAYDSNGKTPIDHARYSSFANFLIKIAFQRSLKIVGMSIYTCVCSIISELKATPTLRKG